MPESGDKLGRAYRELAREEPSASLDAAILAASRRAVKSAPESAPRRGFATRWGAPLSAVAVLVLGIAVALRMQVEQPGIETSMPVPKSESPAEKAQAVETPPPEATRAAPEPAPTPPPPRQQGARAKAVAPGQAMQSNVAPEPVEEKREAMPQAPMVQSAPAPASGPASATASVPAPAFAPAPAARMAAPAPVMKRSATADTAGAAAERVVITPEAELERIAKLRAEGRDDEADRELEAFRKRYPDYRIAEPMLERVRRK
jgi:hypothetical protein